MHKSLSRSVQQGFTLIELIVVIVILGILAATALPKFINVASSARAATISGLQGSINSAIAITHAQSLINATNAAATSTIQMDGGQIVSMAFGYPVSTPVNTGIDAAVSGATNASSYVETNSATTVTFSAVGAATATNCQVMYTAAASTAVGPIVAATTTGC